MQSSVPRSGQKELVFISATPGLEGVLAGEARALGEVTPLPGGVEVRGGEGLHRRANLLLRTASRVLLRVATVPADSPRALEASLRGVDLSPFRGRLGAVLAGADAVRGQVSRRDLEAAAQRVLGLAPEHGKSAPRPETPLHPRTPLPPSTPLPSPLAVSLRAEGPTCTVSVDTSGELLYRRGYRQEVSRAPLRETLAAGVLQLAGYTGTEPLVDPMCGSGTFLIEGAWLSMQHAPGLGRTFAFESFPAHDAQAWEAEKARALAMERPCAPIFGSDLNAGSLGTARRNARRAGVGERLTLERRDVAALVPPVPGPGLVVVNPPYGKRVGEGGDLVGLYRTLGGVLRTHFRGWRAAVLVPEDALGRALGFTSPRSFPVDNGGIPLELRVQQL
ncbi:MAG: RNA methyltransferase [Myxococcaceae bacterium]|nr:RNA methyltransferase [Myxococcaceae bacterium]MCI0671015.1 RNA methyltransferase [Myxococcaceae bacterium]